MTGVVTRMQVPTDAQALGQLLSASGYFSDAREAAQAAVKVMAGQELGFGPIASMTGIYIVKGRVTLSANLMAAAIKRQRPRYDYRVTEHTAETCSIEFLQDGEPAGVSSYSMQDAQDAGLASSETWRKHPRNMLFARALSNGAKWYCPDIFGGGPIYTPDELGAMIDGETGEVLEPARHQVPAALPAPEPECASPAQKKRLRAEITRNSLTAEIMDALFGGVGFAREDGEKVNDAINRLSPAQCSALIDFIKDGAIPTGESDVPSGAAGFEHPPEPDPLPVREEDAA